jgi:tRNA G18 (ribose-2'-O)-methylase SpoU
MSVRRIYSRNAEYQRFETLKTNRNKRHRSGEFFVEGVRNINAAMRCGWHIRSFLYARDGKLSNWASGILASGVSDADYELPQALMEELSGKQDASELLAVVAMRSEDAFGLRFSENPVLALFDRPSNKGNLGTIIRSCDALGVEALLITGHAVDPYDPDVIVASMGSFFRVPAVRLEDNGSADRFVAEMRARYPGFRTIGTSAHAQADIFDIDMTGPVMVLIGNETDGLSGHFRETCDAMGAIPMDGGSSATSLNVACASTVLFYEAMRQRR